MLTATDYPIEAMEVLLQEGCLLQRYHPLIPQKERLISGLQRLGCKTKSEAERLPDEAYLQIGLREDILPLLRRFYTLYDPAPGKFREIPRLCTDPVEAAVLRELYHLPGVKYTRARLYASSGFRCLGNIARSSPEEILEKTANTIVQEGLSCAVPLPKEVRTHIAVARAFAWEALLR